MTMTTATALIALSQRESRTVTEYPENDQEEESILSELRACDDYCDDTEHSGQGHEGAEARGRVDLWGRTWSVCIVHAPR